MWPLKDKTRDFANEPLGDMVGIGAVSDRSARLWLRSEKTGRIRVQWSPSDARSEPAQQEVEIAPANEQDNTCSVLLAELEPSRRYEFRVTRRADNRCLGQGRFETSPPAGTSVRRLSFAVLSCNQPFDDEGRVTERSEAMLRAARQCLQDHDAKFILTIGDQMYSDYPPSLSLEDSSHFSTIAPRGRQTLTECTPAEVRQLYQRRYRHFWNVPGWRTLLGEYPCYPMLDDHEIIDDWGSLPRHRSPGWQAVCQGARAAYLDYQGSRVVPPDPSPESFDYGIVYGDVGIHVMDLRSHRRVGEDPQLYSEAQFARLDEFLRTHREAPFLFIVFTVPIVHLPRRFAQLISHLPYVGEDFSDRWSTTGHLADRDRVLYRLSEHQRGRPTQRLTLLSGDIHLGCAHEIRWQGSGVCHQLVSSGITHAVGPVARLAASLAMRAKQRVSTGDGGLSGEVNRLPSENGRGDNPYAHLNLGLVELEQQDGKRPSMRLSLFGHEGDRPVCRYRSVLL